MEHFDKGLIAEPWLCRACEYFNRFNAQFCGRCGRPFDIVCEQCGTDNPGGHQYCDACGTDLYGELSRGTGTLNLFGRLGLRLSNPLRLGTRRGLVWETPPPNWQWSSAFLREWFLRNRWELIAVFLLTTVGAFLRVYRLEEIPAGFHGDEAWTGIEGLRILKEGWIGPYTTSALGQASGPFYLTALIIWLFDASKFSVRLSMGLFGIATIPTAHLLLRLGFGRWVALFGTTALTVSYWHLHFSRLGFGVVSLALASTAAAAALLWAMRRYDDGQSESRRKSLWSWVAAGALLGFVPYTYFAFPTFFAAVAAVLLVFFTLQSGSLRHKLIHLTLLATGMALSAGPMIYFAFRSPSVFFGRLNEKSVWDYYEFAEADGFLEKLDFVIERVWDSFWLLLRNPRMDGVDGIGGGWRCRCWGCRFGVFWPCYFDKKVAKSTILVGHAGCTCRPVGSGIDRSFCRIYATKHNRYPVGIWAGRNRCSGNCTGRIRLIRALASICRGRRGRACAWMERSLEPGLLLY